MKGYAVFALALCSLLALGCSVVKVDAVKAADIDGFSGAAAGTRAEALEAAMSGIESAVVSALPVPSPARDSVSRIVPALAALKSAVPPALQAQIESRAAPALARVITPATAKSDLDPSDDGIANYAATLTDESFGQDGILVNGEVSFKVTGYPYKETATYPAAMTASGSVDIQASIAAVDGTAFNGSKLNLAAKGSGIMNMTAESTGTVQTDVSMALSAGFSLNADDSAGVKGGKFIVNFKFDQKIDAAVVPDTEYSQYYHDVGAFLLTVSVYGNDNKLIKSYTYTQDDFKDSVAAADQPAS